MGITSLAANRASSQRVEFETEPLLVFLWLSLLLWRSLTYRLHPKAPPLPAEGEHRPTLPCPELRGQLLPVLGCSILSGREVRLVETSSLPFPCGVLQEEPRGTEVGNALNKDTRTSRLRPGARLESSLNCGLVTPPRGSGEQKSSGQLLSHQKSSAVNANLLVRVFSIRT